MCPVSNTTDADDKKDFRYLKSVSESQDEDENRQEIYFKIQDVGQLPLQEKDMQICSKR